MNSLFLLFLRTFFFFQGGIHTGLQNHVSLWKSIKWRVVTPFFFKSIEQGAATTLYAALNVDLSLKMNGRDGGDEKEGCCYLSYT